jgi:hypothetical protein
MEVVHGLKTWRRETPSLDQLRHFIVRNRCSRPRSRCPTGWPRLDQALGGGFLASSVHELLAGKPAAITLTIALRVAAGRLKPEGKEPRTRINSAYSAPRHRTDRQIIYVDTPGDFYPPAAAQIGVPLERLWRVQAVRLNDAVWVCEQALRCAGVSAVVAFLPRLERAASRRLQLAAESGGGIGLFLRPDGVQEPTFAASRLRFDPLPDGEGVRTLVTVLKLRESGPVPPFVLDESPSRQPQRDPFATAAGRA